MQITWDVEDRRQVPIIEVTLEDVSVFIAGYPAVEKFEGFAVSLAGSPYIDFVGYVDSQGERVPLSLHERDPFRRAAREALLQEATRVGVVGTFQAEMDALQPRSAGPRDFHHIEGYR
jgi:hypothetical protein